MARKHERLAEERMAQGKPRYTKDVQESLGRLKGTSQRGVIPDETRGSGSPLGGRMEKKGKR
jgi:hypothetical protein